LQYKDVKKKHLPLLGRVGLKGDYDRRVEILRKNPVEQVRRNEVPQS